MTSYPIPEKILLNLNRVLTRHVSRRLFNNPLVVPLSLFLAKVFASTQLEPRVSSLSSRNRSLLNNILIVGSRRIAQRPFGGFVLMESEESN